ncbi:MAG TPA: MmgE/PrpD family protein, partial [Dehalococcoidia bacterium]|nr:MmgE/PrpD family protein [Dehalococcoidia bacterium]
YTRGFSEADLPERARNKVVEIVFDTIACAVAGSGTEPASIATKLASMVKSQPSATVFGYGIQTSPELATFANTMMVRYYDYNDYFPAHPSDMTAGILAAAEVTHASGMETLNAIALAYELVGGFVAGTRPSGGRMGFDTPFLGLSVALAVGKLWGFNEDQLANAASLALVPNLCLGAVRWGELSMMKGSASAFSTRGGVFAAMLAREGFTGPPEPFEGIRGFYNITGPYSPLLPVYPDGRRLIEMTAMKPLPAENMTMGTLELMVKNRSWAPLDEIESIDIEVSGEFDLHLADEPKYDPKNRETADHSFPFMIARALVDGEITLDTCSDERIADPSIRPLMRKVHVHGSKEMNDILAAAKEPGPTPLPVKVRMRTTSGKVFEEQLLDHSGCPNRGVTREKYNAKLDLCARDLSSEQKEVIRDAWWKLEEASDVGVPIKALAGFRRL